MGTQHHKLDAILEQLAELSAKVDALTPAAQPLTTLSPTADTKPDVEELNALQDERLRAVNTQQIDDAQLLQSYTFEKTGKRDYRDPSNVEPELLQAAKEWAANGRPSIARHQFAAFGD